MSKLLDFVGEIYEASWRPEHWPRVLRMLCKDVVAARSAAILVDDRQQGRRQVLGHYGLPRGAVLAYNLGLARHDPVFRMQEQQPVGVARQVADHREMRECHPLYYRLVMKPADLGFVAALTIYRDEEWHVGLGVHRSFGGAPFTAEDEATIAELFPHLRRAIRIHREFQLLRDRDHQLVAALSRLTLGICIVSPAGKVVYRNDMADLLLEAHPALSLTPDDRLRAWGRDAQRQLDDLIRELAGADPQNVETRARAIGINHPDRDLPLTIMAAPLDEVSRVDVQSHRGCVALYLSDPASPAFMQAETLQHIYGMSPAESAVAIGLANGLDLRQISEQNGVSLETVRSQLKSVFSRMGVHKQQDVIRAILGGGLAARK